jgi:thioredoxin 1
VFGACAAVQRPIKLPKGRDGHAAKGEQMAGNTTSTTDQSFETDVLKADGPVLVDFWAEWCGPCKALAPKLEEIAGELSGKVKIVKLDIDSNQEVTEKFGVRGIPTLILFKGGKQVNHMVGNRSKEEIVNFISSAF